MTRQYGNPEPLANIPPWLPVKTAEAAAFMQVHPKTLLRWSRMEGAPRPFPRQKYLNNQLYWQLGDWLAWWEARSLKNPRSFQKICDDYQEQVISNRDVTWGCSWPNKPTAQHQKRRRRLERRKRRMP